MNEVIVQPIKTFTGDEIIPFSSVYNDRAVLELGLLPSYVNDFIKTSLYRYIHGFEVIEHRVINNNFYIKLSPGCCLINKSIAFIKADTILSLAIDSDWLDYNGYLVSDFYYSNQNKTYNISLYFVRDDGEIFPSGVYFNPDDEHIILALIKLSRLGQNIVSIDLTKRNIRKGIRIGSKTFYVYGYYPILTSYDDGSGGIIGEYISTILSSDFINVVNIDDHTVRIELINTNDIPIDYNPISYVVNDNKLVSHISSIDNALSQCCNRINMDSIVVDEDIYNSGMYITTSKQIDYDKFDRSFMVVRNGINMMPNYDYIYHNENQVRIINQDITIGDVIIFVYYSMVD